MPKVSNVYQDKKSKKWYFVANLGYDHEGKRIRHWERGFATQKDAKIAYSKYMNDFSDSAVKTNSTMSYKEFLDSYFFPDYKKSVELSSYKTIKQCINAHCKPFFNIQLKNITAPMLKKWQNNLLEEYSNGYIHQLYLIVQQSLDLAVQINLLKTNVAKQIKNVKVPHKDVDFWTVDEFKKAISCINKNTYKNQLYFIIVWTLFMTGIRFGEAHALTWNDIDLEKKEICINKSMVYNNRNDYYIKVPKSKAGNRILTIDNKTATFLMEWKNIQTKNIKTNFVFSYTGYPVSKSSIKHLIDTISVQANVHRIKIHALRHSHAALLISLGESALVIKERLGHENIKTTLGIYGHLYPNINKEVANKLNNLF